MIPALYNRKGVPGNSFPRDFLHWHPRRGAGWGTLLSLSRERKPRGSCCLRTSQWEGGRKPGPGEVDTRGAVLACGSAGGQMVKGRGAEAVQHSQGSLPQSCVCGIPQVLQRGAPTTGSVNWRGSSSSMVCYMTTRNQQ